MHQTRSNSNTGRPTLWVVSELYYPEETSTGYYMTRIAEGLSSEFSVKALCGQPNYSARGTRAAKHEFRNGVEIFRAGGTTWNKNVIVFRLLNMLTLSFSIFIRALANFRSGDTVLVVTTPPSLPFVVAFASLIRGAGYTLVIHDNYPEILVAVDKLKETSFIADVLNFANRWLYKYASKIIAVGRDMKELLEQKASGLSVPIDVIQNWAELETVHPEPREHNALLRELGLSNKFVFLYAGNMGYPNDIESILECARRLGDRPEFAFIFLGTGVKEPILRRLIQEYQLTNVTVLSPRPRADQVNFLNACDVALVSLVDKMRGVSMPSRTYNILAAGKPMLALADSGSEIAKVVEEDQVGWHVSPSDPDALFDAIVRIYSQRSELAQMGERARNSALEKYSLQTAVDKYRTALGGPPR